MNQNDLDRYYWRTGQHWHDEGPGGPQLHRRAIGLLIGAFVVTVALLLLQR